MHRRPCDSGDTSHLELGRWNLQKLATTYKDYSPGHIMYGADYRTD